jgi:hypothetical protein
MVKIDTPPVDLAELSRIYCIQFVSVFHVLLFTPLPHGVELIEMGKH